MAIYFAHEIVKQRCSGEADYCFRSVIFKTKTLLKHEYSRSVYGSTVSRMSKGSIIEEHVRLEAELAAREVDMKKAVEINAQKLRLQQLEDQREVEVIKAKLRVYKAASVGQDRLTEFDGELSQEIGYSSANPAVVQKVNEA